jgi:phage/plasmid-like protein (TIGR03299 family)
MTHQIESAFFARQPAWHRLGTVLPESPSIPEAIRHAGLDWRVGLESLYAVDPDVGPAAPLESHFAVVRDADKAVLGVVGAGYRPLQNANAFDFFQPFLDSGRCELEAAGSLRGGRRVFVLARLKGATAEVIGRDSVRGYFLLSNAHDGSQAVRCQFTTIRVVCWNTLSAADRRADAGIEDCIRVRHTANVEQGLTLVQKTVDMAAKTFNATVEDFRRMASKALPVGGLEKYVQEVLRIAPDADSHGKKPRAWPRILEAYDGAPGASIRGVRGTYWGAYNAVTDWVDHARGRRKDDQAARLDSAWFGDGERIKRRAYEVALAA